MKRVFFVLTVVASTFLFGDQKPKEYFKADIYNSWRMLCWKHLSENPEACSEHTYSKDRKLVTDFDETRITNFHFSSDAIQRISSLAYLIPRCTNECHFRFCTRCNTPVVTAVIIIDDDDEEEEILGRTCHCLEDWYEFERLDRDRAIKKKHWKSPSSPCRAPILENEYFTWHSQQYLHFFEHFLTYCKHNEVCECYWPQLSRNALKLSNEIYKRMEALVSGSDLSSLCGVDPAPPEFPYLVNRTAVGVACGLFMHAFFYSHYHQVCHDLCKYLDRHTEFEDFKTQTTIQNLYQLLNEIQPSFLRMYNECLEKHPHPKIYYERGMIHLHSGDAISSLEDMQHLIEYAEKNNEQELLTSEMYQQEGNAYADLGMYDEALEALSVAIEKDPQNKEAYFDRAATYFELGEFEQSLKDYLISGLKPVPIDRENDINFFEFSLGFVPNVAVGANDSAIDFIPGLLDSAEFCGKALWAFTENPIQTSKDFVKALNVCVEFIKTNSALETIGVVAPEVKDLVRDWDKLKDRERGEKAGYIVGKYGIEIFGGYAAAKGIKLIKDLKKANRMLTFESMAVSQRNATTIVSKANEANNRALAAWEKFMKENGGKVTQASSIKGWKVGDPIYNLTKEGKIPNWNAVRQRYWKNKAHSAKSNTHDFTPENIKRMEKGLAPQRYNKQKGLWESMELHHSPPQKDGGLFDFIEVWPDEHALIDKNRRIGR